MTNLLAEQHGPEAIYSRLLFQLLKKPKEWEKVAKKASSCSHSIFERGREKLPSEPWMRILSKLKNDINWFIQRASLQQTDETLLEVFKVSKDSLNLLSLIFEKLHQAKSAKVCQDILAFEVSIPNSADNAAKTLQNFLPFLKKLHHESLKLKTELRGTDLPKAFATLEKAKRALSQIDLGGLESLETREQFEVLKQEIIGEWLRSLSEEQQNTKNPYDWRGEDDQRHLNFVGRQTEINGIKETLRSSVPHCQIVGPPRIGKSTLLDFMVHSQSELYKYVAINVGGISENQFYKRVFESVKVLGKKRNWRDIVTKQSDTVNVKEIDQEVLGDYLRNLFKKNKDLHLVLCFDEFDVFAESPSLNVDFFNTLYGLAKELGRLHFVTVAQREFKQYLRWNDIADSKLWGLFEQERIELGDLLDSEIEGFFQLSENPFDEDDRETIRELADRRPFFLRIACYFFFEAKQKRLLKDEDASLSKSERQEIAEVIRREIQKHRKRKFIIDFRTDRIFVGDISHKMPLQEAEEIKLRSKYSLKVFFYLARRSLDHDKKFEQVSVEEITEKTDATIDDVHMARTELKKELVDKGLFSEEVFDKLYSSPGRGRRPKDDPSKYGINLNHELVWIILD